MYKLTSLLLALLCPIISFANEVYSIKGLVTDNENRPMPGAHILVSGTSLGVASAPDGSFLIDNLPSGTYTLNTSFAGYNTEYITIQVPSEEPVLINLRPAVYNINQIVVTGTRNPKPLKDSPVLTQVLTTGSLEAADMPEVATALENTLPGIEFSYGAYGSNINMFGLSGNYVLFLRDGNRLAGENNGNIDYSRLTLLGTDRIEIVRGASSVLYGSNAMAGVVNIISAPQMDPVSVEIYSRQSNFNTNLTEAKAGFKLGDFVSRTTYKYNHTDGYDLNDLAYDGRTLERTTTHRLAQQFRWTPGHRLEMEAAGSIFKSHVDASLPLRNNKLNDDKDIVIGGKYHINRNSTLEAVWHYDNYRIFEKENQDLSLQYDNRYQNARLTGDIKINNSTRLVAGVEYQEEALEAPRNRIYDKIYNHEQVGYAQSEFTVNPNFTLTAGFRVNFISDHGSHTTWQSAAMYKAGAVTLRANVGTGYRAPTLKEKHMVYQAPTSFPIYVYGNPDLQPETSLYTAVSAEVSFTSLNFSVNVYRNSVREMIIEVMRPYNPSQDPVMDYYYENIENAEIKGVELIFLWKPVNRIIVRGGYGYTHSHDLKIDRQLTGSRKHNGNINVNYGFRHKYLSAINLQGNYYGAMTRSIYDQDTGEETTDDLDHFTLWKALITVKAAQPLSIQFGVDNIFNFTDPETFATFSPGRTFFVSARFSL